MRKAISFLLILVFLLSVMAIGLTGCGLFKSVTLDEAKTNLTNAGYEVTVMSGDRYVEKEDAISSIMAHELDNYLYAVKGEEEIHIFFFASVDYASDNIDFMRIGDLYSGQNNEVVYLATKQARTDAGF
ncbi:MAG: hypothetical protein IJU10_01425 [Clostridia bacterium]|nr:hypothetical protein [Clostridia bacterium]